MKNIFKTSLLGLLLMGAFSCAKDVTENGDTGSKINPDANMRVVFQTPPMQSPSVTATRSTDLSGNLEITVGEVSAATRAGVTTEQLENAIDNLWVLQFNGTGTAATLVGTPEYLPTVNAAGLELTLATGNDQTVYFVANTNSNALATAFANAASTTIDGTLTLGAFESLAKTFATIEDVTANGTNLPLIGKWSGNVEGTTISANVLLERMVAKLSVTCDASALNTANTTFIIEKLSLVNIPLSAAMKVDAATYPATTSAFVDATPIEAYNKVASGVWYIPDNRRGTGAATAAKDKNTNLPAGEDGKATHVVIEGMYTDAAGDQQKVTQKIYLGANATTDFNIIRDKSYAITINLKGLSTADTRIAVENKGAVALPAPANCYIVTPGSAGNRINIFTGADGAANPFLSSGFKSAKVVWQTAKAGSMLIRDVVVADGGKSLMFSTNAIDPSGDEPSLYGFNCGNAVIGVCDDAGVVLWSWHVWVTDDAAGLNDGTNAHAYVDFDYATLNSGADAIEYRRPTWGAGGRQSGMKMMDRSIGAMIERPTQKPDAWKSYGLLYQWGRKDPFPTTTITEGATPPSNIYDGNGNKLPYVFSPEGDYWKKGGAASIADANKEPLKFFTMGGGDNWIVGADATDELWGFSGGKTLYDPCPAGWRVPHHGSFGIATTNGVNSANNTTLNLISATKDGSLGGLEVIYNQTGEAGSPKSAWFAFGGSRGSAGSLVNFAQGYCWSDYHGLQRTGATSKFVLYFNLNITNIRPSQISHRHAGMAVRCVQE